MEIEKNYFKVKEQIESCCRSNSRNPADVSLLVVSKLKPVDDIKWLYDLGHRHFGENYVQEICAKSDSLPSECQLHFIGHLQSNKVVNLINGVPQLYMIETLDSQHLAMKINSVVETLKRENPLKVLIQVNISGETSKTGTDPNDVKEFAVFVRQNCPFLELAGLMAIASMEDVSIVETQFCQLKQLGTTLQEVVFNDNPSWKPVLSMGMTQDFALAIKHGSTQIRIGTAILGARPPPQATER